jgi:uncharacterized iron-regulated protein
MKSASIYLATTILSIALLSGGCATARIPAQADEPSARSSGPSLTELPLGKPELKNQFVAIEAGKIYDASTGKLLSFERLVDRLSAVRVVFLGESHTSMQIHRMQARIIRALYERNPNIMIGMEFFQRADDEVLKEWSRGWLTERGLLYKAGWYEDGGYNFGYYRPILDFARENGLPVIGINIPRTVLRTISTQGYDALDEEARTMVGAIDVTNEEHRRLIRHYFGGANMGHGGAESEEAAEERFERMYAAQRTWDTVFANSVIEAARDFDGIIVVIVGSGHVAYNLGSNLVLARQSDLSQATVMPVTLDDAEEMRRTVRSYGEYLFGVKDDSDPAFYPSFGLSARNHAGNVVVGMLFPGSLAAEAGFRSNDVVLSINGEPVKDVTDMRIRLSRFNWGETAEFLIRRDGEEMALSITPKRE